MRSVAEYLARAVEFDDMANATREPALQKRYSQRPARPSISSYCSKIGRDQRAKTREQVMAAARALYAERGFKSVSVDDVVRRAEVARGTFYIHFADIDGLRAGSGA